MEAMTDTSRGQLRSAAGQEMLMMLSAVEFKTFDKNKDGLLDFSELVEAMTSLYAKMSLPMPTEVKIRKAMAVYDKDHSGTIDPTEFVDLFAAIMLKAKKPRLPPAVADVKAKALALFDALSAGSEGKLARRDFAAVAQQMLTPFMQMGVQMATMNPNAPPFYKCGPQLAPALSRGVATFDVGRGLGKILDLMFDLLDADKCGKVNRHEIKLFFDDIGTIMDEGPQGGMPLLMELFFRIVDKDGDGKLSLEEAQGLSTYLVEMIACLFASVIDIADNVLSSAEVMGCAEQMICQRGQLSPLDTNADGLLSRAEFAAGIDAFLPQLTMVLSMQKDQFASSWAQIRVLRQNIAEAEKGFTMGMLMRGMDWMKGGVDEATFLAKAVPLLREQMNKPQDLDQVTQSFQTMQQVMGQQGAIGCHEGGAFQMICSVMGSPEGRSIMEHAMAAAQAKYCEFAPEICHQIFRLIDIDNSGTVSSREITILKALMDGLLRCGSLCYEGGMSAEEKAEISRMYPELFNEGNEALPEAERLQVECRVLAMAFFDVLDRNGDGTLAPDEIAGFMVKLSSFFLHMSKCYIVAMFEVLKEVGKDTLAQLWTKANLTLISKEEFPAIMGMLPMMLMAPMMQGQE